MTDCIDAGRLAACEELIQLCPNWRKSLCGIGEVVVKKRKAIPGLRSEASHA